MKTLINTFKNPSIRIIIIYIVMSGLWIFGSDWVLENFINELLFLGIDLLAVLKGIFFVMLTGWLFYKLIDRNFRAIQESEERYRKLVESLPEVVLVHIEGEIVYINEAGVNITEAKNAEDLIGKHILDFVPPKEYNYTIMRMNKVQEEGESELREQNIMLPNGRYVPVEIRAFQTTYQGKSAVQVIVRDITERKQSAEKIKQLAYYDTTTGLPNRNQLNEYLKNKIKHSKSFSVMLLDLDRFKVINDNFGHDIGDLLLAQVSERLNQCTDKESFLSRYGEDEYVIVLESVEQKAISQTVEKMIDELSSPFHIKGNEMYMTPSIGISVYPKDGASIDALIKNADTAMYAAKGEGRNSYHFYDLKLHKKNQRKMQLEQSLRKAVEHNELTLYYQPQVDLSTGKFVGIEALVRWHQKELGFISPLEFIPIAEETG
ncbi:hypothetical protein DS031_08230 [Bacillus taeanensis]|uniref:GGDEF domain-containing protein n=1 Tax=Bacillus taeanensis TaxID=273032 RepID=A0A366XWZ9_9BACI|nr:hypothetical protein DS031_08230 [Bacillus taeanensis]